LRTTSSSKPATATAGMTEPLRYGKLKGFLDKVTPGVLEQPVVVLVGDKYYEVQRTKVLDIDNKTLNAGRAVLIAKNRPARP
jgi:hypothetical protein